MEENKNLIDNENQQEEKSVKFCVYCGTKIEENHNYCKNCGRSAVDENIRHCINCGEKVNENQKFCPNCGNKVKNVVLNNKIKDLSSKATDVNNKIKEFGSKASGLSKKKLISIIVSIVLLVACVVVGIINVPKLFISTEDYLSQGEYQKAYEKAGDDEKESVLVENLIAKISKDTKDGLKNPDSFKLSGVWYDKENNRIVLDVNATNSYGGVVGNYWYYYFKTSDSKYALWDTVADFDEETTYSWDDSDEKLEKLLGNVSKRIVKKVISDSDLKLDESVVERINNLNKEGKLKDVKLLDEVKTIYPKDNDGENA